MILMTPFILTMAIYIGAAVIPAVFLMKKIYELDSYEKEPVI